MGIFDGSFSTAVPNLTDSVRLVNNNGYLLTQARNNLIGNVVGTDDSTLNKWEQGVRNLNTQQLINQYKALTPEQLRAYEAQGIDPRQAIADKAGFVYNDFDKDLESARAGAEGRLSDYNDRWLQNQYDLLSWDDQYKAYQKGEDLITKMAKDNGISHYNRDKADILYDMTVKTGQTETQNRLAEIIDKGNPAIRRAFYNGDFKSIAPDMNLRQQDIESAKKMGKQRAISLLADPFKRELLNAHEAGEDITSETVRNNILDRLKSEYGLENSGINSSNINIAFDPNTQDFVNKQEINDNWKNKTLENKAKNAIENSDILIEESSKEDYRDINFKRVEQGIEDIVRDVYPNVSKEQLQNIITSSPKLNRMCTTVADDILSSVRDSKYFTTLQDPNLTTEEYNRAKQGLSIAISSALDKQYDLPSNIKQIVQDKVLNSVGLFDKRHESLKENSEFNERAKLKKEFNKLFNIDNDARRTARSFDKQMDQRGQFVISSSRFSDQHRIDDLLSLVTEKAKDDFYKVSGDWEDENVKAFLADIFLRAHPTLDKNISRDKLAEEVDKWSFTGILDEKQLEHVFKTVDYHYRYGPKK